MRRSIHRAAMLVTAAVLIVSLTASVPRDPGNSRAWNDLSVKQVSAWDYVLDPFVLAYIPEGSRVHEQAPSFWCGTPLVQYINKHGPMIEERTLLERARRLQGIYAPEELRTGPFISESECETEGCFGKIALGIRIVEVNGLASDDGSDN